MSQNTAGGNPPIFPDDCQFDGTNHIAFRDRVLIAASLQGAYGYLDGSIKKLNKEKPLAYSNTTTTTQGSGWWDKNPLIQEWQTRNAWTLTLMVYNMKNPVGLGINMSGSAAEAWLMMKEIWYQIWGAVTAKNSLRATKYSDGNDFLDHISNLCLKWQITVERGADIKDSHFWTIVIASLPESWNFFIVAPLQATKSLAKLIAGLNIHWERLKEQAGALKPNTTAMVQVITVL
ncbi:hypothetical protein H0H87_006383 [Tephrocybe sp. NHM501043]|nr:hypothetical protein H0H87_006383 [Tephrocybe sp. NHM501043]